jgi:hypothetical protein
MSYMAFKCAPKWSLKLPYLFIICKRSFLFLGMIIASIASCLEKHIWCCVELFFNHVVMHLQATCNTPNNECMFALHVFILDFILFLKNDILDSFLDLFVWGPKIKARNSIVMLMKKHIPKCNFYFPILLYACKFIFIFKVTFKKCLFCWFIDAKIWCKVLKFWEYMYRNGIWVFARYCD